jgi:uncharacterized repeat protein (TIGR01451 family)
VSTTPTSDLTTIGTLFDPLIASAQSLQTAADTSTIATDLSTQSSKTDVYIRSEYAGAFGAEVSRSFRDLSSPTLHTGDRIEATIMIKNTSNTPLKGLEYLDTIPAILTALDTTKYRITIGNTSMTRDFESLQRGDYDAHFTLMDIPVGQTLTLSYELRALPTRYGDMLVGDFEK